MIAGAELLQMMEPRSTNPANEIAKKLSGRDYVSWSALSTFRTCPLRYKFRYVDGLPEESVSSALVFGTGIHTAVEQHYQAILSGEEQPDVERLMFAYRSAWLPHDPDAIQFGSTETRASLDALATRMLTAFLSSPAASVQGRVLGVEEEIRGMLVEGVPDLYGRVDLLTEDSDTLVVEVDARYGVFEGTTFKRDRFANWLIARDIPWPRLGSGQLQMDDDTFRSMAKAYPAVAELRELRAALGKMRLFDDLAIGPDGRNRTAIMPFRARTGRNQPSNAKFIFGPSRWLRSLIKPEPGMAVVYIDYGQQEFGIAAALSVDNAMAEAYRTGDPYLAFGKQAGAIPPEGTKKTHGGPRALFKACVLAVQYGMGAEALADRIGQPVDMAKRLLRLHRETYPAFWKWSEAAVDRAMLLGRLETVFGWPIHVGPSADPMKGANARSLANFPCQAHGAEMLRLACCMLVEAGIGLCAPIHDAVLIEGPADSIDEVVERARGIMAEASKIVLGGFEIGTEFEIVRYPDRYIDEAGADFWNTVTRLAGPVPTSTYVLT